MNKNLILIVSLVVILFTISCSSGTSKTDSKEKTPVELASVYYTCTMHPEIHSDKPGKCPICGMDLVKAEVAKTDSTQIK
jgi:uncharacterized protein YceK